MNDKIKDTAQGKKRLEQVLGNSKWACGFGQTKTRNARSLRLPLPEQHSFKPEDRKRFCSSSKKVNYQWVRKLLSNFDGDDMLKSSEQGHEIALVPGQVQEGCQRMLHGGHSGVTGGGDDVPPSLTYHRVMRVALGTNGELVRELPLHHPSWRQMPPEEKAGVMAKIGTQFDMRPHMEYDRWPLIYAAIQQHLQKIYNGKKAALKERYWIPDSDGTYDLERIRQSRPSHISEVNWDAQIAFWNDPKNRARAAQNKQNRAKSKVMESSATREYPSLIHTFFLTHTVNGVFLNPEDKALYDEMMRLQGLGSNTEMGVPYTKDEIMAIVRGGKQWGHIPGVGRVLPGQRTVILPPPICTYSSDVTKLKKREKVLTRQVNMFMKLFRSDDKFSQMLTQLESQPEIGGGSGSGGCGDDEQGDDEDDGKDGEGEDDS
ncbi:hypothetical protein Tco_1144893 [Tanacetum coccineum]